MRLRASTRYAQKNHVAQMQQGSDRLHASSGLQRGNGLIVLIIVEV